MKAVTPVRLAHAPRKAGPAVVRVKTIIEGGGFSASALWQRVGRASSPLTRRGLGRGARRARHARQCGLYDNQQRCRGHPPRRARHGLYGNLRSRRHPCVQRPERGIPRGDGRRAPVGQETYESGFQSELIKNKFRRSRRSDVEGTRLPLYSCMGSLSSPFVFALSSPSSSLSAARRAFFAAASREPLVLAICVERDRACRAKEGRAVLYHGITPRSHRASRCAIRMRADGECVRTASVVDAAARRGARRAISSTPNAGVHSVRLHACVRTPTTRIPQSPR